MSDDQPFNNKMRLIRFRMKRENLRFADEIRLVPRGLVAVVFVLFVIAQAIFQIVNRFQELGPPGLTQAQSAWAVAGIVTAATIPIASLIFLIGYVNRDARRRGMNAGLWTFLVTILLPAWLLLGFVIYFLVREPLPYHCTQCGAMVSARFNYCPSCKYNLRPTCEQCKHEVGEFDRYCPHCGFETQSRLPSEMRR
ncbi:MAG TPA: zinc ribbon domain-containing protein [Bryobacteraceae bacterium]|nr:zinc ribbon domain-containing protein [Bryobacteraceae bacterium]